MALKFNPISGQLDVVLDKAEEIKYDNVASGLAAVNLQEAVDELKAEIDAIPAAPVDSVNGQTGVVVLDTGDIAESGNLYFTDERAQDAVGTILDDSTKISLVYNDATPSVIADIIPDSLVNADINSAAGIVYSKLNLSNSIVNADVAAGAAIVYSKLSLSNSILNADINASAAIAYSKLATLTANRVLLSDASGFVSASTVTNTTLGFLDATSSIQTQLNARQEVKTSAQNSNFVAASTFTYLVDSSGGAIAVTLPSAAANAYLFIKDAAGAGETNNITINGAGGALIDGAASYVMSSEYQSVKLVSNGTDWFIT